MSLPLFRKFFGQGRLTPNKTFSSNSRSQPLVGNHNYIKKLKIENCNSIKPHAFNFKFCFKLKAQSYIKSNRLPRFHESEALHFKNEIRYINFISVAYLLDSACKNIPLFYKAASPRPTFYDQHFKNKALRTSLTSEIQNNFRLKYVKNCLNFTFFKIAQKKTVLSVSATAKQKSSARRAALKVAIFVSLRHNNFDTKIKKHELYIYMDPLKVKQNILRIILDKNLSDFYIFVDLN